MSTFKNVSVVGFVTFMLFVLGLVFGSMMGFNTGVGLKEKEAIRVGVAEWVADKDGRPRFKWKEPSNERTNQ